MLVSDQMPIFEAAVPCEVFGIDRSDLASPWYRFSVVGIGDGPVALSSGFTLTTSASADTLKRAGTVIVPACANVHEAQPEALVEAVRAAHRRGARILSICSGAFVLAAAGVLDGRRAATHWLHAEELARRFPAVTVDPAVLYVEDDNVITSAGTAAGIDACLHLVRLDHGAGVAAELARRMVTPPHREGGQAQYFRPVPIPIGDDWLAPLLDWINENLHRTLVTADLAMQAAVSNRTLERRFTSVLGMSPLQWLLQQRVRRAQHMLETSDRSVEWVATACGFGTTASLRAHFARIVGLSPSRYRQAFRDPLSVSQPRAKAG
jgi:AraC family transcriptional regulator, transcriptional activator FtrA